MKHKSASILLLVGISLFVNCLHGHEHSIHGDPSSRKGGDNHDGSKGLKNEVKIYEQAGVRIIEANNIPDHDTGIGARGRNPHIIREQEKRYQLTLSPKAANEPTSTFPHAFGVALNGVFFEPSTAEFWHGNRDWNEEAIDAQGRRLLGLDENFGHVQPDGSYHYHSRPTGLIRHLLGNRRNSVLLLGYAADGFPIYDQYGFSDPTDAGSRIIKLTSSYRLKKGRRQGDAPAGNFDGTYQADYEYVQGSGDLDEFNGRYAVTPEYPEGIYHYVITETFPFISRSWRGTPDSSFFKRRGPDERPRQGLRLPPHEQFRGDRRPPAPPR